MKYADSVSGWVKRALASGVRIELPYEHGIDCVDCGGEGAYGLLFPEQSEAMVREIWSRAQGRAQGVLCFSQRCVAHFRKVLGNEVEVRSISELAFAKET